jgi:hypothetical protein
MTHPILVLQFPLTLPDPMPLERPAKPPAILPAGDYIARAARIADPGADSREYGLWEAGEEHGFAPNAKRANVVVEIDEHGWGICEFF